MGAADQPPRWISMQSSEPQVGHADGGHETAKTGLQPIMRTWPGMLPRNQTILPTDLWEGIETTKQQKIKIYWHL